MLLSDVLKQPTVAYKNGDLLAANTESVGYAPSIIDTEAFVNGKFNFRIKGVGTADDKGDYPEYRIVPVVLNDAGTAFVDDDANPVVIQTAGKVVYATGRNDIATGDVYKDRSYLTIDNIAAGEEARTALNCFVEFVHSEYSLGVNDFNVSGPSYTAAPAAPSTDAPSTDAPSSKGEA